MPNAILWQIAEQFGTPCYVYFLDHIVERITTVRQIFDNRLCISYAMKANPNRALLRRLAPYVDHLDISSGGELIVATEADYDPALLTFVGPGKADWELRIAAERNCGQLVVESTSEMCRLDQLGDELDKTIPVMLRVNPKKIAKGYGVAMATRASQFGIDEEELDSALEVVTSLKHVRFSGFHIFAGTQCLDADSIVETFAYSANIFKDYSHRHNLYPSHLIFGSGFGILYHDRDKPFDLQYVAEKSRVSFDELRANPYTGGAELSLEMGRFLVGEAGYYLASVLSKKSSRGREILILDGGMNHQLGASGNLGNIIKRNYPIHRVTPVLPGDNLAKYDLVGPLCTSIDLMGRDVELGPMERGDVIAIGSSGAYGLTASPTYFITHRQPREFLVETYNDKPIVTDITREGTLVTPPAWPETNSRRGRNISIPLI